MIFSQLSLSAVALLTSLQGVVAAPSPEAAQVAPENKYEVIDIITVGDYNVTLYEDLKNLLNYYSPPKPF